MVGHTRLQASFWLAQLAKQASVAASARRNFSIRTLLAPAMVLAISKASTAQSACFMDNSDHVYGRRRVSSLRASDAKHEFLNRPVFSVAVSQWWLLAAT